MTTHMETMNSSYLSTNGSSVSVTVPYHIAHHHHHQSIYENINQYNLTTQSNPSTLKKIPHPIYENIDDLTRDLASATKPNHLQPTYENYSQFILHHQLNDEMTKRLQIGKNHVPPVPQSAPVPTSRTKSLQASSCSSGSSSSSSPPSSLLAPTLIQPSKSQATPSTPHDHDVKIQIYFCGTIMVIYVREGVLLDTFVDTVRQMCEFERAQPLTLKWVDEEGDPCTVSSQTELDEALRLYFVNKESELVMHVFANAPDRPGVQCAGEDRSIYRRGARRWRKLYLVNGHKYQAKRFARNALCKVCEDRIWGLGRQGYKCLECKTMVHKRCHKYIGQTCEEILEQNQLNGVMNVTKSLNSTISSNFNTFQAQVPQSHSTHVNLSEAPKSADKASCSQQQLIDDLKSKLKSKQADTLSHHVVSSNNSKLHGVEVKDFKSTHVAVEVPVSGATKQSSSTGHMSLDKFDLIKVIGRGSYAKVFLVEYKMNRKCYAMKVIKKTTVNDDEDIDWVQTEKHVFEQATNHPFLVGLHSCFQTESRLFFIIEYLCGGDLMYHMQNKRKLPEDHARFYSAEIAIALDFLHSRGIIYRDLKLDNVLLDIEGHIKLTDYGMCKEGLGKGEKTSTFCGTPNYIAPEMLRGEDYGFSIDWWALGVLMYEMMAGRSPFEPVNENPSENPDLHTEDHLFQVILEKPIRIPRNLSVRAASVLKAFLQKAPEDRLGTYDGLREIQQHLFFKQIDWQAMEQKLIQPPYRPPVQSERDLTNIDKLFTNEPVVLTPDSPNTLARIQQTEFDGFEYINPLILSDEIPV